MQSSLHSTQARSIVRIWRSSDTAFPELLALKLAPIATTNAECYVTHPVERVRDMDAGYVASCMMLPKRHRGPQVDQWGLLIVFTGGRVCRHFGMSQWFARRHVVLHIAHVAKQTLASHTLILALTYPAKVPHTSFTLPERRTVLVRCLPAVLALDHVHGTAILG